MITEAGLIAGRWLNNILFYESYGTYEFEPDVFIEMTKAVLDEKTELLKCHVSQISKTKEHMNMIDTMVATARYRGFQAKIEFAEGYKSFRYVRKPWE